MACSPPSSVGCVSTASAPDGPGPRIRSTISPPSGTPDPDPTTDPVDEALLAESVGTALMVVLDRLGPAERVAFVLHDVFGVPFDDVAEILGRSPDASRQLASRARRRLQGSTPDGRLDLARQRDVVDAFLRAARGGEFEALMQLLDPDVVLLPDAAAVAMGVACARARGAEAVATALSGGAARRDPRTDRRCRGDSCGRRAVRSAASCSSPCATSASSPST